MAPRKKKKPKDLDRLVEEDPFFVNSDPVDPSQPVKEMKIGNRVYVTLPKYSRKLRMLMKEQADNDQTPRGTFRLPNGTIMEFGKTYLVELTPEIKDLLVKGILMGGGKTR